MKLSTSGPLGFSGTLGETDCVTQVEWGVGVVQEGLQPGKVVEDSLSAFVTVCDSSEAKVLRYDAEILMLRLGRVGPYIQMVQLMSWRHGVFFSQ